MSTTLTVRLASLSLHRRGGAGGQTRRPATNPLQSRVRTTTAPKRYRQSPTTTTRTALLHVRASAVPLESMCSPETYSGAANLWLTQELPRLLATLPAKRPCDGLVLTRGSW
jgi:hypothetical protein